MSEDTIMLPDIISRLEAELAACQKGNNSYHDQVVSLHNKCVALREALVKARNYLYFQPTKNDCMLAAIDAVLKETSNGRTDTPTTLP